MSPASRSRRQFLEQSAAAVLVGLSGCGPAGREAPPAGQAAESGLTNWAGNLRYGTSDLTRAASLDEVREFVRARDRFRVLGTRHSFSSIADSRHALLSLRAMDGFELDGEARSVTVEAGASYGQLCPSLHERGFALHNLASLPHISVAGACATATHGSGVSNGNLATAVSALELVTADGEVVRLAREDGESFQGAVVGLGALGVVTRVTLDVEPAYEMRQDVYLDLPMESLEEHFEAILSAGYSVSLFTDWRDRRVAEVWVKRRVEGDASSAEAAPELYGAALATRNVHPIVELSAEHCTEQMGVPGPWYERLPHFRMGFTPSSGDELQAEYFVPRSNALDAILAVERLREQVSPHLFISELRTVAADELWMSTAHGRDSLAIHFTWKPDWESVRQVLPVIERELSPYGVRPHWGKLFTIPPAELQSRYEKLEAFKELAARYDPAAKLRNEFLASTLYA